MMTATKSSKITLCNVNSERVKYEQLRHVLRIYQTNANFCLEFPGLWSKALRCCHLFSKHATA